MLMDISSTNVIEKEFTVSISALGRCLVRRDTSRPLWFLWITCRYLKTSEVILYISLLESPWVRCLYRYLIWNIFRMSLASLGLRTYLLVIQAWMWSTKWMTDWKTALKYGSLVETTVKQQNPVALIQKK